MNSSELNARIIRARNEAMRVRNSACAFLPERLSGIHNAWGPAAALVDTWAFLDLCEDAAILDAMTPVVGPDIVLWDSELYPAAADYCRTLEQRGEGRWWPVDPLAGGVAVVALAEQSICRYANVSELGPALLEGIDAASPLFVIRYMSAASRFVRDPEFPANWRAMEERPLVNLASRPLWLLRGADRASNDFVTGFAVTAPRWTEPTREGN